MKKKLLFKLWKFPYLSETFILAQIITAIKCGFEVRILVEELLDFEESKLFNEIKEYEIDDKIIIEDYGIPKTKFSRILRSFIIIFSNIFLIPSMAKFIFYSQRRGLRNIYEFNFYKKIKDFDIIHVQYGTNARPLDVLKKINYLKSKLIVSFHGHDAFFPINGIIQNNGYYNVLFENVDFIVANTKYLADKILELGLNEEKLRIIPVGVDTKKFEPRKKLYIKNSNSCNLISVGRLDKVKGHSYAIETTMELIKKGYKATLTIVGEGKERVNLENLIQKKGLNEKVLLRGRKSQSEVHRLLLKHDIYILAAVAVQNERRETQGLATLEAQACGLPVVAFDSGGVRYTLKNEETGFLVTEYDINAMVTRIIELIEHPEMRIQMGENAIQYMNKEFSQNRIDEVWCQTYKSLLKD